MTKNYTDQLRSRLQQCGIPSFHALSRAAGVSIWQVTQLRQGKAADMQLNVLSKLSQALHCSLADLLTSFSEVSLPDLSEFPSTPDTTPDAKPDRVAQPSAEVTQLRQEYDRLQAQLAEQRQTLWHEFQHASLQTLESLLLQLPTAAYAAQQNPDLPAARLLPLLRPINQLLSDWGIAAIAPVGAELPYNPQQHHLLDGTAQPGDLVKVRYTGYIQGDRLLHRAKVSPINR